MRAFYYALRYGDWVCGWERWEGKPWLSISHHYYDGDIYVLHIGWLYVECWV